MKRTENAVNWFEIPATNFPRAVEFYSKVFGTKMETSEMAGSKMAFFPADQAGAAGAVVHGEDYVPSTQGTLVYLNAGEDLADFLRNIEPAGGKILVPKTRISDEFGNFALFLDSEGNKVGLHSPK